MSVRIVQYKWAGSWRPFSITVPCGECSVTEGVIADTIEKEFSQESVSFEVLPWLTYWWRPLIRGGWHAPIVLVNNRVISQGSVLDRGLLAYHIRKELAKGYEIPENATVVFTKPGCSFCARVKTLLKKAGITYEERDIIANPLFAHQLFTLTKRFFPRNKPVTTPQVWLKGRYVGGFEEVDKMYK